MLVYVGLQAHIYSYPLLVERILGKKSRFLLEVAIALTQYGFVVSYVVYLTTSWSTAINTFFSVDTDPFPYAVAVFVIFTLLSWVRDLTKFSFAFTFGVLMIVITVIYLMGYACKMIAENGMGPN